MVVGNTYFKKEDEKLITFKSGTNATTIDYVLVNKKALSAVKNVKVVPGEECFLQHRLLVVDLAWKQTKTWKGKIKERVKLWRLREDHIRKVIEEEIHEVAQNAESWDEWSEEILRVAAKRCEVSTGHGSQKITWWWNDHVAEIIDEKRRLFKEWQKGRTVETQKSSSQKNCNSS